MRKFGIVEFGKDEKGQRFLTPKAELTEEQIIYILDILGEGCDDDDAELTIIFKKLKKVLE